MKDSNKFIFIIILSSLLLAFFLAEFAYYVYYAYEITIYNVSIILIAQLIVFSLTTLSVLVFSIWAFFNNNRRSAPGVTKIILLSESNSPKEEFSLINRTSVLIGKRDTVYIRSEIDLTVDGYAVLNCVDNFWYVERVFDERSVGLKRAGEQFVYRLKIGMSYKLQVNDIIYIGTDRLLIN